MLKFFSEKFYDGQPDGKAVIGEDETEVSSKSASANELYVPLVGARPTRLLSVPTLSANQCIT